MDVKRIILLLSVACSSIIANDGTAEKLDLVNQEQNCQLTGWWRGDLHSYMYIVEDTPKGHPIEFDGIFFVRDPEATGALPGVHKSKASLRGARSKDYTNSFGFVVSYKGGGTGVWVGQCLPEQSKDHLETVWLYRTPSEYEEQWSATRIGKDKWIKVQEPEWYTQS